MEVKLKVHGEAHPSTLNNIAGVYRRQRRYEEALETFSRALKVTLKVLGEEHSEMAATLNDIADAYESQGRCEEVLEHYGRALKVRLKALGEEHRETFTRRLVPYIDNMSMSI